METPHAPSPNAGQRLIELDVLRGVAILLVLGIHSPSERGMSGLLHPLDAFLHQFGWTGVDLFFVLSGYLIGGLLFSEIKKYGALDVKRFLVRRMFRIWPAYYVFLVFLVVRLMVESGDGFGTALAKTWPGFVHIQNFIEIPRDQLWSLAIEEHFYLALPAFLFFLLRRQGGEGRLAVIPKVCLYLGVACLALRIVFVLFTSVYVRTQTFLMIDALFFGVSLAYFRAYRPSLLAAVAARRGLLLVSAVLFVPALFDGGPIRQTIGYTGLYLGYGLILIRFTEARPSRGLLDRFLSSWLARVVAMIGANSYSIYLWHRDTSWWAYELGLSAGKALGLPGELVWVLHTSAYVAASIAGGVVLGKLIEVPALKLRDRIAPSRTAAVPLTSAPRATRELEKVGAR